MADTIIFPISDDTGQDINDTLSTRLMQTKEAIEGISIDPPECMSEELIIAITSFDDIPDGQSHVVYRPDGVTLVVDEYGTMHCTVDVPIATTSVAGKVIVGNGLLVDSSGRLSVDMTNLNEVMF